MFTISSFKLVFPAFQFTVCFCFHTVLLQRERSIIWSGLGNCVVKPTVYFILQPSTTFSSVFVSASCVPWVSLYWANTCARASDQVRQEWKQDWWRRGRYSSFSIIAASGCLELCRKLAFQLNAQTVHFWQSWLRSSGLCTPFSTPHMFVCLIVLVFFNSTCRLQKKYFRLGMLLLVS